MAEDLDAWGSGQTVAPLKELTPEAPPAAALPADEAAKELGPTPEEMQAQRDAVEQGYCKQQLRRVLERARSDLSLKPYAYPMMDASAIWTRTIAGCRGDLPDGRFCEIDRDEVRFGNIKFAGSRRTPLT